MVYFIRTGGNRLFCVYGRKKTINCREYAGGEWGAATALAQAAGDNFYAEAQPDGTVTLVFADSSGNAAFLKFNGESWRAPQTYNAGGGYSANTVISLAGGTFIYNEENGDGGGQSLFTRPQIQAQAQAQTLDALRLDKISNLPGAAYQLQKITPEHEHYLLFYNQKKGESQLGYREIVPGRAGDFVSIYGSNFSVSDVSVLTTHDCLFAAIAVKGLFSQQILFKEKSGGEFSKQIVVWEGQRLERVLLSMIEGSLVVHFISGGLPYSCSSQDGGKSFLRPQPWKGKIPASTEKAAYVSAQYMHDSYFIREILVDSERPWAAQFIPELWSGFYPENTSRKTAREPEFIPQREPEPEPKTHYEADQEFFSRGLSAFGIQAHRENEYNAEYISRLRNKISDLEQENLMLQRQLNEMTEIKNSASTPLEESASDLDTASLQ